jgi:hypothetical protein
MAEESKRKYARAKLFVAVGLDGQQERSAIGVTRNASQSGLLMVCSRSYQPGEEIVVHIRRGDDKPAIDAVGRVVRVERDKTEAARVFPWRIAVELKEPLEELGELVGELEVRETR